MKVSLQTYLERYSWLCFPIAAVCIVTYQLLHIHYGLDSVWDEGYLYLILQNNYNNGLISGSSQWSSITNMLCGQSSLLALRYISYATGILGLSIFIYFSNLFLSKFFPKLTIQQKVVIYSFIVLLLTLSLRHLIIHYNQWQRLWYMFSLSAFLGYLSTNKSWVRCIYLWLVGFFCLFSILTILPGGVLITGCLGLLIIIHDVRKFKDLMLNIFSYVIGILCGLVVFHLCFADLFLVWDAMQNTAQTITTLNRGYDFMSFLNNVLLFCRDTFFIILVFVGMCWVASILQRGNIRWGKVLGVLFMGMTILLLYKIYKDKSGYATPVLYILAIIGPIYTYYQSHVFQFNRQDIFKYSFILFLFLFPLIASIGTNVYLGKKMPQFVFAWGLLVAIVSYKNTTKSTNVYLWVLLGLFFVPLSYSIRNDMKNTSCFTQTNALKGIYLTSQQADHFNKVYDIMSQYGYEEQKSVVWSTGLSHMTIVALNADYSGLFYTPMDFTACLKRQDKLKIPDFLLMTQDDINKSSEELKKLNWGYPNEFDMYYVGTPETRRFNYPTERWLLCRKLNK